MVAGLLKQGGWNEDFMKILFNMFDMLRGLVCWIGYVVYIGDIFDINGYICIVFCIIDSGEEE